MENIFTAAAALRQGKATPVDLLEQCLQKIDRFESKVRAWVFVDRERARADAEALTAELQAGHWRGPLHGIPIAVKDIFDVFDWPTGCGSKEWARSVARRDATVVERLRQAGAVFLGKTVTTQYASFDPPVTRNPWNLERTPGGSSSGSAAALACGMCLGALGSQTGGSITRPASYCGVAGCKPTYGRVSADGVMPLASSMDHPGPMASCVQDLAILLQTMAGYDPRDSICANRPVANLLKRLEGFQKLERPLPTSLSRLLPPPRIGRIRGLFDDLAEPVVLKMMDAVSEVFREEGATLGELVLPAGFSTVIPSHRIVMAVEAAAYHRQRLERHPDDYLPKIRGLIEEGLACPAPDYALAREHQRKLTQDMLALFTGVDVLLTPATTGAAPAADTTGNPAFNSPWSFTGLPTVSFPTGRFSDGLPLAIQLVGPPWSEAKLLAAAAWCEAALSVEPRLPPLEAVASRETSKER